MLGRSEIDARRRATSCGFWAMYNDRGYALRHFLSRFSGKRWFCSPLGSVGVSSHPVSVQGRGFSGRLNDWFIEAWRGSLSPKELQKFLDRMALNQHQRQYRWIYRSQCIPCEIERFRSLDCAILLWANGLKDPRHKIHMSGHPSQDFYEAGHGYKKLALS